MFESTLAFVRRNMKVKTIITDEGIRADKPEYPLKVARKLILWEDNIMKKLLVKKWYKGTSVL